MWHRTPETSDGQLAFSNVMCISVEKITINVLYNTGDQTSLTHTTVSHRCQPTGLSSNWYKAQILTLHGNQSPGRSPLQPSQAKPGETREEMTRSHRATRQCVWSLDGAAAQVPTPLLQVHLLVGLEHGPGLLRQVLLCFSSIRTGTSLEKSWVDTIFLVGFLHRLLSYTFYPVFSWTFYSWNLRGDLLLRVSIESRFVLSRVCIL